MINQNEKSKKSSRVNIKLTKREIKYKLYFSPYEKVIQVLKALRNFISNIKDNNKALEELDWVINIITNNLLYHYSKTLFYNNNMDIINGNHKIADFENEVDKFNKNYEDFCQKYIQLQIKNEEHSRSLSFIGKNISIINNPKNINSTLNYQLKIKPLGKFENQKKVNKKFLSQFPINIINNYSHLFQDYNDINSTDFNMNKKMNMNKINLKNNVHNKKNKVKELSLDSQSSPKSNLINNNSNSLFKNYKILNTANTNLMNNENQSFSKQNKVKSFDLNDNSNNNPQQSEKILSLPIIQFNFNGGVNIDKYKINLYNEKNELNNKSNKFSIKKNNRKFAMFEQEINYAIPKIPPNLIKGIDINSIFDFQNFNIFNLKDKLGLDNVMPFLGKEIIKKINIMHFFDEFILNNFLMVLSKTYQNTRALYHTSLHGVDVCYSTLMILTFLKNEENKIDNISDLDIVTLIIAALAHDVGHPGFNNKFMVNSKNELALLYNDISVLENFHCAKTFQLLDINELNIFKNFSKEDFLLIRKKMIGEILATDMAFHFKIVDEYKEYKKDKDIKLSQFQLNFITHIADLFHNYRKFHISLRWVEVLSNEFWNQGDKEKELGLPISFLCDREDVNVPKSQVGFLTTFSLPTIQELVDVNIKFDMLKNNAIENRSKWDKLDKEKRKRGWTPKKNN